MTIRQPTFVERARREAAKPLRIGDLTPAETTALHDAWREQLKPSLIAAAVEQRKLRSDDLARLDGFRPGTGLVLDDVLDFLLSPQGAPLQLLLEQHSRPDHRPSSVSFIDDDEDSPFRQPAPYNTPAPDSFTAHLREARLTDIIGDAPQQLLRAVVKSFAEATGNNGRIDVDKVKTQGPVASALYTLIAERTKGSAQNNTQQGQKLVGLDDATVARVGRGVDVAPIRSRMVAFDAVVDTMLGDTQPLKGVKVIAIQHLMPTLSGVLDGLERAGVDRKDMRLIGKSYSTVDEMYAWLIANHYVVHDGSIGGNAQSVEEHLVEAARDVLEEMFDGIDPTTSKERFLLADDGGKLLYALHTFFPQYAPLCAGFEQTARGIQVLDKMQAEGTPVACPIVNMARSELKSNSEIPLIGENVVFDTLRALDDLKMAMPKTAAVLGYGPVGQQVARALLARGVAVVVVDPDPKMQALARAAGCDVQARDAALKDAGLVIGCTGRGALNVVDDHHLLKDGAILVNGASGNHELGTQDFGKPGRFFLEAGFEADRFDIRGGTVTARFQGQPVVLGRGGAKLGSASMHRVMRAKETGKEVLVLRSGHVINLGRDLPPEFIQVTRALVFASMVQAAASRTAGVVDVDPSVQAMISREVDADLARQGLSFADPDFSRLASWDL